MGIEEYTNSTPIWPQSNSSVKSFMKPLKKVVMTSAVEEKNWRKVSPAELLFNGKIRGQLPEMTKQSKITDRHKEATEIIQVRKPS